MFVNEKIKAAASENLRYNLFNQSARLIWLNNPTSVALGLLVYDARRVASADGENWEACRIGISLKQVNKWNDDIEKILGQGATHVKEETLLAWLDNVCLFRSTAKLIHVALIEKAAK